MSEDQALALLRSILARPEYNAEQSVPWWQQLLEPVFNFLWGLLIQIVQLVYESSTGRQGGLGLIVLGACGVVLLFGAVYVVRAVRLSVVRENELHSASLAERRERSDQLWQSAQRLAAAGQLPEAVRLVYLSALYALDEHALLHVEVNLTNREYALRLKQLYPALGDSFSELVDRYERVRYGRAAVAEANFADFSGRAQRVRSAALEGAAAA